MKPKFIKLHCGDPCSVDYTVDANQIVSFGWEPWNAATAVTMKSGVVIYVTDSPAKIEKKILSACQPRCKPSVEDASAHPSEEVRA